MAERYRIEDRLGDGPFGAAFKAWHHASGRYVSLQLLRPGFAADVNDINFQRILSEVRELDHEQALKVLDFGRDDSGQHFVVTEYFNGTPLDRLIADLGPMAQRRAITICAQVADVLAGAHAQGVVHAGLTARAVLLGPDHLGPPVVKLRDFGLARLLPDPGADDLDTEATDPALRDLIASMGPERALPGRVQPRSDVYALGALLYQLVRGRSLSVEGRRETPGPGRPFMAAEDVDLYGLDEDLADLIFGLLASEPDERIQGAAEAARSLLGLVGVRRGAQITPSSLRLNDMLGDDSGRPTRPTLSEAGFQASMVAGEPLPSATGLEFGAVPTLSRRDTGQQTRHAPTSRFSGDAARSEAAPSEDAASEDAASEDAAPQDATTDGMDLPSAQLSSSWRGPPTTSLPPWRKTVDFTTPAAVEPAVEAPVAAAGGRARADTVVPDAGEIQAALAAAGVEAAAPEEEAASTMRRWAPATPAAAAAGADAAADADADDDETPTEVTGRPDSDRWLPAVIEPSPHTPSVAETADDASDPGLPPAMPRPHRVMPSNVSVSASGAFLPWRDSGSIKPVDPARDLTNSQIVKALDVRPTATSVLPSDPVAADPVAADPVAADATTVAAEEGAAPRSIEAILAVDQFFDGTASGVKAAEKPAKVRPKSGGLAADSAGVPGFWSSEQGRWLVRIAMASVLFVGVLYFAVWHGQPTATAPSEGVHMGAEGGGQGTVATAGPTHAGAATAVSGADLAIDETARQGEGAEPADMGEAITPTLTEATEPQRHPVSELPAEMVRVPGNKYAVGCKVTHDRCQPDAMPMHEVELEPFGIMIHEVTVANYRKCVSAGACKSPGSGPLCNGRAYGLARHPVNCVSWQHADTYCRFRGWRLPTEAEWEVAARGREQRVYPWGSQWPSCSLTVLRSFSGTGCGKGSTSPAGQHPGDRSWVGVHGLGGNVSEWVFDEYGAYPGGKVADEGGRKVIRGGNLTMDARGMRAVYERDKAEASARRPELGFRCAVDVN